MADDAVTPWARICDLFASATAWDMGDHAGRPDLVAFRQRQYADICPEHTEASRA